VLLSMLYTCYTTEAASGYLFMMAWHSDFSSASYCVQYFWNSCTGTSVILVYAQVHRLFWIFANTYNQAANWYHCHKMGVGHEHAMKSDICTIHADQHMIPLNHQILSRSSVGDLQSDCECHCFTLLHCLYPQLIKKNFMVWALKQTIPTERPPLVGEVSANFSG
jgi:hypothetical protein